MPSNKTGIGTLPRIPGLGGNAAFPAQPLPPTPIIQSTPTKPGSTMRRPTLFPQGPRLLGLGTKRTFEGGPGNPPDGFVTATTSSVEWILYWASFKLLIPDGDPRQPPYNGDGIIFSYQVPTDPHAIRSLGSAVDDFVYYLGTGIVIVRLDTWYFHITADPTQVAKDAELKRRSAVEGARVVTLFDTQIVGDPSGRAACAALANALNGNDILSPTTSGLAYAIRDAVTGLTP